MAYKKSGFAFWRRSKMWVLGLFCLLANALPLARTAHAENPYFPPDAMATCKDAAFLRGWDRSSRQLAANFSAMEEAPLAAPAELEVYRFMLEGTWLPPIMFKFEITAQKEVTLHVKKLVSHVRLGKRNPMQASSIQLSPDQAAKVIPYIAAMHPWEGESCAVSHDTSDLPFVIAEAAKPGQYRAAVLYGYYPLGFFDWLKEMAKLAGLDLN